MKKLLSLFLVFTMLLGAFASCDNENQSSEPSEKEQSSSAVSESESETERQSESDTQKDDLANENSLDKYTKLSITQSQKPSDEYYTEINIDFSGYELPHYAGYEYEAYMLFETYEKFASTFKNGYFLDEGVFEDNYVLAIYRHYGGKYSHDLGFRNFRIEDGEAKIDHTLYTGYGWAYNDCDFSDLSCLLIPKTEKYEQSDDFEKIEICETMYYSNEYYELTFDNASLEADKALFISKEDFDSFAKEQGLKYYYKGDYLIMPTFNGSLLTLTPTLEGSKLTLDAEIVNSSTAPTKELIMLNLRGIENVDDITEIELSVRENNCDYYKKELSLEEWQNAVDATLNAENYTVEHVVNFKHQKNVDYLAYAHGNFKYSNNRVMENMSLSWQIGDCTYMGYEKKNFLWDYNEEATYFTQDGVWIKQDGIALHDCEITSEILEPLKDAFYAAQYRSDNTYVIDECGDYHDVTLRISNGKIVYLSYNIGDNGEGKSPDERHTLTYSDYGTTVIEAVADGEEFN